MAARVLAQGGFRRPAWSGVARRAGAPCYPFVMSSHHRFARLARALGAVYASDIAPRQQQGLRLWSTPEVLALPGVVEVVETEEKLARMLRVISEFSPRSWFSGCSPPEGPVSQVASFQPPVPSYWVPGRRFLLAPPSDYRPHLVVETRPEIDDDDIQETKQFLFGIGCHVGVLLDVDRCVILRDSFAPVNDPSTIEVAAELMTGEVLAGYAPNRASLDDDVERWLQHLVTGWRAALPRDRRIIAAFLEDVAPAALGATMNTITLAA